MQRKPLAIATILVLSAMSGGVRANATEPPYLLSCTSLWTALNNAPLTIKTEPFTDVFEVNTAENTVGGVHGMFNDAEISWENAAADQAVRVDRTTHVANTITGKYVSLIRSFNPTSGSDDISEYVGHCERYVPQL